MGQNRIEARKYKYYICGQCKTPIEYLPSEEPPIPCPDCGWNHYTKDMRNVPENLKYPIK